MTVHQGEPTEKPPIPGPIHGIAVALLGAPLLQAWCLLQGQALLNFGPGLSAHVSYFVFAPMSAVFLLRRHPRARSSLYIFTTFEILRSLHSGHLAVAAVALALLLYLQLPSVRAVYPMIDPQAMRARLKFRGR